ncbi:MAG: pirin family protein [Burkholderiales bacterium]|nr:pirin family protein [Burkholderiales bacterium]
MTAGSGLVHSELPSAEFLRDGGVMHGFQIWVNLPAKDKMIAPRYQEIPSAQIPESISADGRVKVRVIAGEAMGARAAIATRTPIMFLHYTLQLGGQTVESIPADYRVLAYAFSGDAIVGAASTLLPEGTAAVFDAGTHVALGAAAGSTEVLVLAGVPLNEPIARHGPFVMNRQEELVQALQDYQAGKMGRISKA